MNGDSLLVSLDKISDIYRFIAEKSPISIVICDISGKHIYSNRSFKIYTGYTEEDCNNLNTLKMIAPENMDGVRAILSQVLLGKRVKDFEYSFMVKDGNYLLISSDIVPMMNSKDEVIAFLTMSIDISTRKMAELNRIRLIKLDSLADLSSRIAHLYNNILLGILGNVNLLQLNNNNLDRDSMLHEIESSVARAHELSNQLLTFSEGGEPIKTVISIVDILDKCVSYYSKKSNNSWKIDFEPNIPFVEVDVNQISQAIGNILVNAEQAITDHGMIYVSLSSKIIDETHNIPVNSGNYIRIRIKDTGIGISKTDIPKIFTPYFSTKGEPGLSLATSFSIVRRHFGTIELSSDKNGTVFNIYLPASEKPKTLDDRSKKVVIRSSFEGRVLLLDDDETIRSTIQTILTHLGLSVTLTTTGEETIKMYEYAIKCKEEYDLVILDLTIPDGMGGKVAIEKLKLIDPNVMAVVSSGYSNDPIIANYVDYGFIDILPKPYSISDLKVVLSRNLS